MTTSTSEDEKMANISHTRHTLWGLVGLVLFCQTACRCNWETKSDTKALIDRISIPDSVSTRLKDHQDSMADLSKKVEAFKERLREVLRTGRNIREEKMKVGTGNHSFELSLLGYAIYLHVATLELIQTLEIMGADLGAKHQIFRSSQDVAGVKVCKVAVTTLELALYLRACPEVFRALKQIGGIVEEGTYVIKDGPEVHKLSLLGFAVANLPIHYEPESRKVIKTLLELGVNPNADQTIIKNGSPETLTIQEYVKIYTPYKGNRLEEMFKESSPLFSY